MTCNTPGLFARSCLHGKSAGADEGDEDRRRSRSELKNTRTAPVENGTPTERQGARGARSTQWSDPRRHPVPLHALYSAQRKHTTGKGHTPVPLILESPAFFPLPPSPPTILVARARYPAAQGICYQAR
ncbi:hypothetical protein FIBSPDRAFT_877950 [Athelia psychrophila]|uniref:Uncharacterized protein n=1 Tax=Athelia psychrophila TaxID=1759441 RepID=A0A167VH62_9AGAM|nr:hypothetical protein FIBSPDRAFT_877950 [Fibularhizoctonia sp. CBS 109695]